MSRPICLGKILQQRDRTIGNFDRFEQRMKPSALADTSKKLSIPYIFRIQTQNISGGGANTFQASNTRRVH